MIGDILVQHGRILIFQLSNDFLIEWLSPAAEAGVSKSLRTTLGRPIWDILVPDKLIENAFKNQSDSTIFDHQVDTKFGGSIRGDIHIQWHESGLVLWIYEHGRGHLLEKSDAARNAANIASGMAAMLAHEIRNPLGSIRGATQLLADTVSPSDQGFLDVIIEESDRIGRLVAEFEDMAGTVPPQLSAVNIHVLLRQVQRAAMAGYGRGCQFNVEFDPSLPDIACDSDRMLRALHNLTKNACEAIYLRFGDQMSKGRITFTTRYRAGLRRSQSGPLPVEITIQDNGGGIPPELADEIFRPFVTTKSKGTGLGLSVVARMIEEMGGVIEYENSGDGTQMRIYAPVYSEKGSE